MTGGIPYLSDEIPLITEASEEIDLIAQRLEGGETSIAAESIPLLLTAGDTTFEPFCPDPKGKRKAAEKYIRKDEEEKKRSFKRRQPSSGKSKKAIHNIIFNDDFATGVESQDLKDLAPYISKRIEKLYEEIAHLDIGTETAFSKFDIKLEKADEEKNRFEGMHLVDAAKLAEQEKSISDLEAQLAELKKER